MHWEAARLRTKAGGVELYRRGQGGVSPLACSGGQLAAGAGFDRCGRLAVAFSAAPLTVSLPLAKPERFCRCRFDQRSTLRSNVPRGADTCARDPPRLGDLNLLQAILGDAEIPVLAWVLGVPQAVHQLCMQELGTFFPATFGRSTDWSLRFFPGTPLKVLSITGPQHNVVMLIPLRKAAAAGGIRFRGAVQHVVDEVQLVL